MAGKEVATFEDIRPLFEAHVQRIVWAQVATVDRAGKPRMRLLHPVWAGPVGYAITRSGSLKMKHLARTPWVSIGYWDPAQSMVYAECAVESIAAAAERELAWDTIKAAPPPYGYDPDVLFAVGPESEAFTTLRLTAQRIEVIVAGAGGFEEQLIWRRNRT